MKFRLHNKIEIIRNKETYTYYNTMLKSIFEPLLNLKPFNNYIAIGDGIYDSNEKTQKLTNYIKKYTLNHEILQNDLSCGQLYVMKSLVLDENELSNKNITEIGLCSGDENDSTIYNYITLITQETPYGIEKKPGEKLLIKLYIYLDFVSEWKGCLCLGQNKLISLCLGEGLTEKVFAVRGFNCLENRPIFREFPLVEEKYFANVSFVLEDDLILKFEVDLGIGETDEIVFVCGDSAVARINVLEEKNTLLQSKECISRENKILDLGSDVESVLSVKNQVSGELESNYYLKKYAKNFADKIVFTFDGLFDYKTPRFLSKDEKMLFFVKNDFVYGYMCENGQISQIMTSGLSCQHIRKIVSFDKYVFIITKSKPYVNCYVIEENKLVSVNFNLSEFENFKKLQELISIDVTMSNSGKFLMPIIMPDKKGITIYFDFDKTKNSFVYDSYIESDYEFSYLLAMYKNSFSDAMVMFIKGGEYSFDCRLVTHYYDKTINDVATVLAYDLTHDTKEIYMKNRTLIVEKTTQPRIFIYYFPGGERYNLTLIKDEIDDYFSTNMNYVIQKYLDGSFKIYNIVGYDDVCAFETQISDLYNVKNIKDFEFLNGALLIFSDVEDEPIVAFSLKENSTLIENVGEANTSYNVEFKKYDKIGKNNEGVRAIIKLVVNV